MSEKYNILWLGRYEGFLRALCQGIKDHDLDSCRMAAKFYDEMIPFNSVVVPMPSHSGKAEQMLSVCVYLQMRRPDIEVVDMLCCKPHTSSREEKINGFMPQPITMMMNDKRPKHNVNSHIFIIDNVVASGVTANAALKAMPEATVITLCYDFHR